MVVSAQQNSALIELALVFAKLNQTLYFRRISLKVNANQSKIIYTFITTQIAAPKRDAFPAKPLRQAKIL